MHPRDSEALPQSMDVHTPGFDALVLDAELRQSLVAVRSIGRRRRSVAAMESADNVAAFASRWCSHAVVCPAETGTAKWLRFLESWLDQTGARVVLPSHDGTIALL